MHEISTERRDEQRGYAIAKLKKWLKVLKVVNASPRKVEVML
jgi:hypothetical protein